MLHNLPNLPYIKLQRSSGKTDANLICCKIPQTWGHGQTHVNKSSSLDELWEEAMTPALELLFIFFHRTVYRDNGRGLILGMFRGESSGKWHKLLTSRMVWSDLSKMNLTCTWFVFTMDLK